MISPMRSLLFPSVTPQSPMASIPTPSSLRRGQRPTWLYPLLPLVVLLIVLSGCSLHRFQGPDDQLYIGIKDIKVTDTIKGSYADNAVAKAEEKLQYAPNSAIFGSSSLRWPFPLVRPYLYSSLAGKKSILASVASPPSPSGCERSAPAYEPRSPSRPYVSRAI